MEVDPLAGNAVFNHNFQFPPNSIRRWPPGWERAGGNAESSWYRVTDYAQDGRYCLLLENPTGEGFCGIREAPTTPVPVRPGEVWRATVTMRAEHPGRGRLAVQFLDAGNQPVQWLEQELTLTAEMREYSLDYVVPPGAGQALVETGMVGQNRLWIDRVVKTRLEQYASRWESAGAEPREAPAAPAARRDVPPGLAPGADNHYFVALLGAGAPETHLRFGRHLTLLGGKTGEQITFTPPGRVAVAFYEAYLEASGSCKLELGLPSPEAQVRYQLPAAQVYLRLPRPLRVTPEGSPLVVRVVNPGDRPISYTFLATGLVEQSES